jgi:tetratricopeptide (TPR) repeat protein
MLCIASTVHGQSYGTERPFVLGTDARVSAMGGSGVNMHGTASLQFYNPANLTSLQWNEFVLFRTVLFDSDTQYNALSYGHPFLNIGAIGVTVLRLDVAGIEERDETNQLLSSDLANAQTRLLFGYGHTINRTLSAGFNLKIDHQSFGGFNATGVGLDIGLSGQRLISGNHRVTAARAGFVIRNLIEPSLKLDQDNVPDPMEVVLGGALITRLSYVTLETTLDFVQPRFSPFELQFGQDVRYREYFAFRFGVDDGAPTAGFGVRYKNVSLDYAYRDTDLGNNNRFSLAFRFGASIDERKTRVQAQLEQQLNSEITQRLQSMEEQQFHAALAAGDSLFDQERFVQARDQYELGLMWDPGSMHARERLDECRYLELAGLGQASIAEEDYAQGLFYARQVLELRPDDAAAAEAVEYCRVQLAASENATRLVNKLLSSSIDLYAAGQYAEALRAFEEVLELDESNTLARQYRDKSRIQLNAAVDNLIDRARAATHESDYEAALALLERASRMDASNDDIAVAMDDIYRQRDEQEHADVSRPVVAPREAPPNHSELQAKYLQGLNEFNGGRFDTAVQLLTEVWMGDSGFDEAAALLTRAHLLLGMRQYSQDHYDLAIQQWRRALDVDPDNIKAKRYIRRAEEEIRRLDRVAND